MWALYFEMVTFVPEPAKSAFTAEWNQLSYEGSCPKKWPRWEDIEGPQPITSKKLRLSVQQPTKKCNLSTATWVSLEASSLQLSPEMSAAQMMWQHLELQPHGGHEPEDAAKMHSDSWLLETER